MCPRNPNRPWFGWLNNPAQSNLGQQTSQSLECCRRFNGGKCKQPAFSCRYSHRCIDCSGPHPASTAPGGVNGVGHGRAPLSSQPASKAACQDRHRRALTTMEESSSPTTPTAVTHPSLPPAGLVLWTLITSRALQTSYPILTPYLP